jgi:hypothetical protein
MGDCRLEQLPQIMEVLLKQVFPSLIFHLMNINAWAIRRETAAKEAEDNFVCFGNMKGCRELNPIFCLGIVRRVHLIVPATALVHPLSYIPRVDAAM